jgi:integrase
VQRGSLKQKLRDGAKWWHAQWREPGQKNATTRWLGRCVDLSRSQARAELDKILAPINARAIAPRSNVTLRQYVESEYLIVKTRVWKASTAATTEQIIETHILADLGERALSSLTRRDLQAHLDTKAAADLSASVVGHVRWQLVAIFAMAVGDGLINVNPTQGLVTPRCKTAPEKRVITAGDVVRGQLVLDIRDRLIFRLAVSEGMRPSEIVGLQIGDVQADEIHITRRMYRRKEDSPKSWRSRRVVPPTTITAGLIASYIVELLRDVGPAAWLFPSEVDEKPVSYSNVYRRRIRPALAKVGLGFVNFQILRRTWVTEMGDAESDPRVRAALAGHSVDVSENEYRQAKPEALRGAMAKLGERLQ